MSHRKHGFNGRHRTRLSLEESDINVVVIATDILYTDKKFADPSNKLLTESLKEKINRPLVCNA